MHDELASHTTETDYASYTGYATCAGYARECGATFELACAWVGASCQLWLLRVGYGFPLVNLIFTYI